MPKRTDIHSILIIGAGPIIARGANINPQVYELLLKAAKRRKIPVQVLGAPRATGTDANVQVASNATAKAVGAAAPKKK